jgi:hypothetical protein
MSILTAFKNDLQCGQLKKYENLLFVKKFMKICGYPIKFYKIATLQDFITWLHLHYYLIIMKTINF